MTKEGIIRQLFEVVKNNKVEDTKDLLKHEASDTKSVRHGRTALHYAAMRSDLAIIEALVNAGADVNSKSEKDFHESIIHCAAVHPHPLKVFQLLDKHGANFHATDSEGTNALHLLVGFDSVFNKYAKATSWDELKVAIEFLVNKGLDPAAKGCSSGTSAIEAAHLSKKLSDQVKQDVVDYMRKASSSFEATWIQSKLPTDLHEVFRIVQTPEPYPALQTFLRDHDVSQLVNGKLENPLHVIFRPDSACRELKKIGEAVGLLLNADVSPSDKNLWGRTTLDYIQHYSAIDLTLKKQIIEQLALDRDLGEKLLQASTKNDTKQIRILLDRKSRAGTARANYHSNGRRAIHLVALHGSATSLEILLSKGARPDRVAFGDYSETPVHCACINAKPRVLLEALERYGANLKVLDAAGNSALDILVGGETCFGLETTCLDKENLLQAIEFLMENGLTPKDTLEVDKQERMSRETREHVKELINRRKSQQWMTRIDSELKEIRDTRSAIQTKLLSIEAVLSDHNLDFDLGPKTSSPIPSSNLEDIKKQVEEEVALLRSELEAKLKPSPPSGDSVPPSNDDFQQLFLKTETAKIENFTAIEGIRDKLVSEVRRLREDLFSCQRGLEEERERLDEEKMSRLELEGEVSELKKQVKTDTSTKETSGFLEDVGEDSTLEEVLPQLDELAEKLTMLEDKIEHVTKFGATDAPLDAIIELTAKLKQEFQEFKSDADEARHVLDKVKNNSSLIDVRVTELEENYRAKQELLDKLVVIVERTGATAESQSAKLALLEDSIRQTREQLKAAPPSSGDRAGGSSKEDRDEIKRLEEKVNQVKEISCSLIEAASEKQSDELQIVQENLHEMIMSVEDKVLDASFTASQTAASDSGVSGGVSSDLLNQQLAEVRVDKDMIIQRLNVAETARFELQKGVDSMRDRVANHKEHGDATFESQRKSLDQLRLEFDGFRDHESTKRQFSEERDSKIDEQLNILSADSAKAHSEFCEINEKDVNTKKWISKLSDRLVAVDDEISLLSSDRNHNVTSLEALKKSILDLEKLLSDQMAADIEQGQKTESKLADLVTFRTDAGSKLESLDEDREQMKISLDRVQSSVKTLANVVDNDRQLDTISAAVLELSENLAKQGERIVAQDKTIAVSEHRIKQTSTEIDEKIDKYEAIIDNVKQSSTKIVDEVETLKSSLDSSEDSNKLALEELSELLLREIENSKDQLVKKQNNETKEIAKQIFRMDKEFKAANGVSKTNAESIANLRGKVELVKDTEDGVKLSIEDVEFKVDNFGKKISTLESSISKMKSQLISQQSAVLDGESVAQQVATERDRLLEDLEKSKTKEAELISVQDMTKRKLEDLSQKINNQEVKLRKVDGLVSEKKVREIVGDDLKEVHDILDDTCGRLLKLEDEKASSDANILKEAEKATKTCELLIQREESHKSDLDSKLKRLTLEVDSYQTKLQKDIDLLLESKGKTQRELQDLKFELDQSLLDLKTQEPSQRQGISLQDELCAMGSKMDIIKQVESAEQLAKIEAELIRLKGDVQQSQNKSQQSNKRSTSIENDLSELLVAKNMSQMKLDAAETDAIELRGKYEGLDRTCQSQASKIDRLERLLKTTNQDLVHMAETLEQRTLQLSKERRENEANVNYMERMKIEMEMKMEDRDEDLKLLFLSEIQKALGQHDEGQGDRLIKIEKKLERQNSEFMMVQQMNDANNMQHEEARRQAMKAVKIKLDEIQRKTRGQMAVVNELALGVQELQELQENNTRGGLSHKLGDAVAGLFGTDRPASPTGSVKSTSTTATWWRR